jgi:hypothetical protein
VKALAFLGKRGFNVCNSGAGAGGHDQLHRVVFHNTGVLSQAEGVGVAIGGAAHKAFGAAAHDIELLFFFAGVQDLFP